MTDLATLDGDIIHLRPDGGVELSHSGASPEVMRWKIDRLVRTMLEVFQDEPAPPVEHEIADGMYMRKLFIPRGTLLAGKIHKKDCLNIVAAGDITVLTEFGCRRVTEGFTGVSRAGLQKIGFAHEDTIFINVFRTDLTDLAEIEAEIAETERSVLPHDVAMKAPEIEEA